MSRSLKPLEFLLGGWRGIAEGFGNDSDTLTTTAAFSYEPEKKVISGYRESRKGKTLQNRVLMWFLYDENTGKFIRKDSYSYGFIVNQEGGPEGKRFSFESVGIDSEPDFYKGVRFRTFIQKMSSNSIMLGVETAKPGKRYALYGQQKLRRLRGH